MRPSAPTRSTTRRTPSTSRRWRRGERRADRDRRPPLRRRRARAPRLLHRHDAVHRLQVLRGRVQAVERPARRRLRRAPGALVRPYRRPVGGDVAPCALRRGPARGGAGAPRGAGGARRRRGRQPAAHPRGGHDRGGACGPRPRRAGRERGAARGRDRPLAFRLRRVQALHERRLPRRLPDRRANPHRVRDGDRAAGRVQRLRLLRHGVPVRRHRPRPVRRPGREVPPLLRPPAGRHGARVREGVPHGFDPVRPVRRARRAGEGPGRRAPRARDRDRVPLRRGRRRRRPARRRPRRVLPPHRAARALRPARARRLADPGERAGGDRRRARRGRRRGGDGRRVDARRASPQRRARTWARARVAPVSHGKGPPPEERIRAREQRVIDGRDITPAVGTRGEPGDWRRAAEGAEVRGFRRRFEDAGWSFLYRTGGSRDAAARAADGDGDAGVSAAARAMRGGRDVPVEVKGPVIRPNVWTWEVPVYFWFGGTASGAAFAALACEAAGDARSARVARMVAIGAAGCGGPLLIMDLGRPERFLHMFRIFKPRSPMSLGAWCLLAFSNTGGAAVAADLLGRRRTARALSAATAVFGLYLGSYTGVLLASTAVPAWARSRRFLGPIFMCTATASGAAATRLALATTGTTAARRPARDG